MDTMPIDAVVMDAAACFYFLEQHDAIVLPAGSGQGTQVIIQTADLGEVRATGRTLTHATLNLVTRVRGSRRESLRGVLDQEVQRG